MTNRIVLDTNCLIASLSKKGNYFPVWQGLHQGKYTLCVSNEILEEYEEILSQKTNATIASNVIQVIINSPFVEFINTYFHFHLIYLTVQYIIPRYQHSSFLNIYLLSHLTDQLFQCFLSAFQ